MDKSWEKIILAVSLILLALGAVGLALTFPAKSDVGDSGNKAVATGAKVTPVDPKVVAEFTQGWEKPVKWDDQKNQLFISDPYLYDRKEEKILAASGDTVVDAIPLKWLLENNLDIKSGTVALNDPDSDGFSNKMEYAGKTDPTDPASHPPFLGRLRLKAFDLIPFRLKFQSYNDLNGVKVFQINLLDIKVRPSRLVKIGDQLEGYVVTNFEQKVVKRLNAKAGNIEEEIDESTLTIEKPEIGFKIDLIINKTIDSPESTARFIMLLPGQLNKEIVVQRGKELQISQEPNTKYLLLRADGSGARIRNLATKEEIDIPKVTDQDIAEVPAPKDAEKKQTN